MILDNLFIVDPAAEKPDIYEGVNEIIRAWEAFYQDYDNAEKKAYLSNEDDMWEQHNTFRILIHRRTRQLLAIRDYGMYQPSLSDFLFRTEYLPLFTHQPENAEALLKRADDTLNLFNRELDNMTSRYEKPLFLVEYLGANDYKAWSLAEDKYLFVYGYKAYREEFRISEMFSDDIRTNTEYGILPPSKELIERIASFDTDLTPEIWSRKMRWDYWDPRPEKIPAKINAGRYAGLYAQAIQLINMGRSSDLGCGDDFYELEANIDRFERLVKCRAPAYLIDSIAKLLEGTVVSIKEALSL